MEALLSPICQIAENAGYNSEDIVDMQKSAAKNQGFDAKMVNGLICLIKELLIRLKLLVVHY